MEELTINQLNNLKILSVINNMPYKSAKQRAWMHINEPTIAKRWDKKYGGKVVKSKAKKKKK